jgi:hypothetical protein
MSRDPAFLFYTSDFLTGTMTMSNEQIGKYIRLLCMQHQKGELSEKDMLFICGTYDEDIFSKFQRVGLKFVNKRLAEEIEKRKNYSESRRKNRLKKDTEPKEENNISKTYVPHMENENENDNSLLNNTLVEKKEITLEELKNKFLPNKDFATELYKNESANSQFYNQELYRVKRKFPDDNDYIEFNSKLKLLDKVHTSLKDYALHFRNWLATKPEKKPKEEVQVDKYGKPRPSNQYILLDGKWTVL